MEKKERAKQLLNRLNSLTRKSNSFSDRLIQNEYDEIRRKTKEDSMVGFLDEMNDIIETFYKDWDLNPLKEDTESVRNEMSELFRSINEQMENTSSTFDEKVTSLSKAIKSIEESTALSDAVEPLIIQLEESVSNYSRLQADFEQKTILLDSNIKDVDNKLNITISEIKTYNDTTLTIVKDTEAKLTDNTNTLLATLKADILSRLNNTGGGSQNRQIKVDGVDVLKKYTDINLVAGTNVTLTTSDDSTNNNVSITIDASGGGAGTLAEVSTGSTDTAKSLYTMTSAVDVEFETSDGNTLLYLDETNERVGVGTSTPLGKFNIEGSSVLELAINALAGNPDMSFLENGNTRGQIKYNISTGGLEFIANDTFSGPTGLGNANLFVSGTTGNYIGINTTSPDRLLHVEASDAVTNAVTYTNRWSHITSGTATTSFGVGEEWELENASGTNRVAATQEFTWSDATNATEDTTYTLKLMKAGTLSTALTVNSVGALTTTLYTSSTTFLVSSASGYIYWQGRSTMYSPADGVLEFTNNAGTDFSRIQFGGTTSSFPSIKRSGTGLQIRLADDSAYAPITASTGTFSNGVVNRVITTTDDATAVIDVTLTDTYELTAVANNTTFSTTGTPVDGQKIMIRYKDAGVSKTITWDAIFVAIGITLPVATTAGKWGYVGAVYNSSASKFHCIATVTEA